MKKILISTVVAAIILNIWGFIYWAISPMPGKFLKSLPLEAGVTLALKGMINEHGVYVLPGMPEGGNMEDPAFVEKMKSGPLALMAINPNGQDPSAPDMHINGLLFFLGAALIVTLIVRFCRLQSFRDRYLLVLALAFFATFAGVLPNIIWWHFPMGWVWLNGLYNMIGWAIAGLVVAKFAEE